MLARIHYEEDLLKLEGGIHSLRQLQARPPFSSHMTIINGILDNHHCNEIKQTYDSHFMILYFYSKTKQMHNISNLFYFGNNTLHILCLLAGNFPASEF
jgi:Golgi nucleoside diphosphatase